MDLATIEQNVGELDVTRGFDLIFDLLAAYGMPKASITRLRKGSANRADRDDEVLWKGKVYYRDLSGDPGAPDPHVVIDDAAGDDRIAKQQPRFLIVRTASQLLAVDTKTSDSLDIPLEKLALNAAFFMPWAGVEKTQLEAAHYADIKAAEKMAQLYDEIRKVNDVESDEEIHALNVFFTRLLFCFFAEDTGIFEDGQVTKAIGSLTHQDGSDLHHFLGKLFETLDTPVNERGDLPSYLAAFGYVNGSLFAQRTGIPVFSAKARSIILECAELDWSEISPDIFGSMMQAVVNPEHRATSGMHYTSVENILRVLRPLLLDELESLLQDCQGNPRKLERLWARLAGIHFLDPACGSGNFLVVAYQEIRRIEIDLMRGLRQAESIMEGAPLVEVSRIELSRFCGIEIDDFAHEVAGLALWFAKHQMDARFAAVFGFLRPLIPLREGGGIVCGNALRLDWGELIPRGSETYVVSNPPYLGGKRTSDDQVSDLAIAFERDDINRNVDYVAGWIAKSARFVVARRCAAGLVATNSVCQGLNVGLIWPTVYAAGAEIVFAETSFRWSNSARGNAGVVCVVLGLAPRGSGRDKVIRSQGTERRVTRISPYLIPDGPEHVVVERREPLSQLPAMEMGNVLRDGGHLVLSADEYAQMTADSPEAARFIRPLVGAAEFLGGSRRYCLAIDDEYLEQAIAIPAINERLERVRAYRAASDGAASRSAHLPPHRFHHRVASEGSAILVPQTSSELREWVPVGLIAAGTLVVNAGAIYGGEPWLFALLSSRMHAAWLRSVGGRMKTDLRYSARLVYNTFPVAELDSAARAALSAKGLAVLAERERFPERSPADLYAPETMPRGLRQAHVDLDDVVDRLYQHRRFRDDADRVGTLLSLHEAMSVDGRH